MDIKFYNDVSQADNFPAIHLAGDNWDDFGFKITFKLYVHTSLYSYTEIGDVKILDETTNSTYLPPVFSQLPDNFCSLGQSLEYYEKIKLAFPEEYLQILRALNDITFDELILEKFNKIDGFRIALFRFTSAEKAFLEAKDLLIHNVKRVNDNLDFTYFVNLPGATDAHKVYFDFKSSEDLPFRINVLIGKNGTGKTSYLGSMVNSISGIENKNNFIPYNPLFSKVIAISYSLFDDFPKPQETTIFSYKYIGLRTNEEETISDEKLSEKLKRALTYILSQGRSHQWFNVINKIIPLENLSLKSEDDLTEQWIEDISYEKAKRLSSGQSIILFILTELIANIQDGSLVLFDEPETHLHPSAIAQLMNCFYEIIESYESYAIMSTHSPLIIQDVPGRYISVFDRQGNLPIIRKLSFESFGENVSELTSIAFGTIDVKELYKEYLEKIFNNSFGGVESVNQIFENKLSFNAQLYLTAFEQNSKNEKS